MQGAASLAEPRGAAFMSRRPGWMALLTMQLLLSLPSSYKELQSIHCFTLDLNGIISLIGHPCLLWGKYVSLGKMTQQLGLRKDLVMQPRLVLNLSTSCHSLSNAAITAVLQHAWSYSALFRFLIRKCLCPDTKT